MDSTANPENIVAPSLRARVIAAAMVALAVSSAAVFFLWGQAWLLSWLADRTVPVEVQAIRSARLAAAVIVVMVLLSFGTAAWLGCMAKRIRSQGVFPPSGYPVLKRTPQVQGAAAQRKAQEHAVACGMVLILEVVFLAGAFYFLPLAGILQNLH